VARIRSLEFRARRVEAAFDRDDLVADDAPHLVAQHGQFFGQHETVIAILDRCITSSGAWRSGKRGYSSSRCLSPPATLLIAAR
jgi:hypothetical protein